LVNIYQLQQLSLLSAVSNFLSHYVGALQTFNLNVISQRFVVVYRDSMQFLTVTIGNQLLSAYNRFVYAFESVGLFVGRYSTIYNQPKLSLILSSVAGRYSTIYGQSNLLLTLNSMSVKASLFFRNLFDNISFGLFMSTKLSAFRYPSQGLVLSTISPRFAILNQKPGVTISTFISSNRFLDGIRESFANVGVDIIGGATITGIRSTTLSLYATIFQSNMLYVYRGYIQQLSIVVVGMRTQIINLFGQAGLGLSTATSASVMVGTYFRAVTTSLQSITSLFISSTQTIYARMSSSLSSFVIATSTFFRQPILTMSLSSVANRFWMCTWGVSCPELYGTNTVYVPTYTLGSYALWWVIGPDYIGPFKFGPVTIEPIPRNLVFAMIFTSVIVVLAISWKIEGLRKRIFNLRTYIWRRNHNH